MPGTYSSSRSMLHCFPQMCPRFETGHVQRGYVKRSRTSPNQTRKKKARTKTRRTVQHLRRHRDLQQVFIPKHTRKIRPETRELEQLLCSAHLGLARSRSCPCSKSWSRGTQTFPHNPCDTGRALPCSPTRRCHFLHCRFSVCGGTPSPSCALLRPTVSHSCCAFEQQQ